MKIALDNAVGVNVIKSYAPGRVQIRERHYSRSLIVMPHSLLPEWGPDDAGTLRGSDFRTIIEHRPEVLILGTGERQVFPDPAIFATLMDLGIGCEVMDNAAACRTYNILIAEERRAALALMFTTDTDR
jgi:uncharacterized protein